MKTETPAVYCKHTVIWVCICNEAFGDSLLRLSLSLQVTRGVGKKNLPAAAVGASPHISYATVWTTAVTTATRTHAVRERARSCVASPHRGHQRLPHVRQQSSSAEMVNASARPGGVTVHLTAPMAAMSTTVVSDVMKCVISATTTHWVWVIWRCINSKPVNWNKDEAPNTQCIAYQAYYLFYVWYPIKRHF